MKLSVIIPTYNRADTLRLCLEKLIIQEGVDFEIIVVDDGSTDETKNIVKSIDARLRGNDNGVDLKYLYQKNAHQGAARNHGVQKATGDILLFIGDDILPEPHFLKSHLEAHTLLPDKAVVVLGHTTWDPVLKINPYMKFLESSGWQFAYHLLTPGFIGHPEPYKFFYTSNISLKKSFFQPFNESFKEYGWEDIELGYRLHQKGMRIYYEPDAKAFHHHCIPESSLKNRMRAVGRSAVQFQKIQPTIQVIPTGFKAFLLNILTHPAIIPLSKLCGKNMFYKLKSWQQFLVGVKEFS